MRTIALTTLRILGSLCLAAPMASAGEVPSAFFVAKSQNKNQVHYGVRVDDKTCAPSAGAPVWPYWRMLEKGPKAIEGLTDREEKYFGIDRQEVEGPTVRIVLRGLPSRPVVITTWRDPDGICQSASTMTISGSARRLYNVYVAIKLLSIDYLQLTGWADDGSLVREKIVL
jgi:hypothetical protein